MESRVFFWIVFLLLWGLPWISRVQALTQEAQILLQMKTNLKDPYNALNNWKDSIDAPCNWEGITCDNTTGMVTEIKLENKFLNGPLYSDICLLQNLKKLELGSNELYGNVSSVIMNCIKLQSLNLSHNFLSGSLPDFSQLKSLQLLDLTYNNFTGKFPTSVGNLPELISLNLAENPFSPGKIPQQLMNLKKLEVLYLANCNLVGEIPSFIFNFTDLGLLDLCKNHLHGSISKEISKLSKLYQLELYTNNLSGIIPPELGNLTLLSYFDISKNRLSGNIPREFGNLRNMVSIQLYMNQLSGQLPESLGEFPNLAYLSLYQNHFNGHLPQKLGSLSKLEMIEVSENQFTGPLPKDLCKGGNLHLLLVLDNSFSGELPESYADCKSLVRFRVNNNSLTGRIPKGIWGLPNVNIIDLSFNSFAGEIGAEISNAKKLSELYINNNHFSGTLVPEIGMASLLVKLDAHNNQFTGSIPKEIGSLVNLNALYLQENEFEGPIPAEIGSCISLVIINLAENNLEGLIPESLASIQDLNSLNLSNNKLSGSIPKSIRTLKLSLIDFSNNHLTGPVPNSLISSTNNQSFSGNPGLCAERSSINIHVLETCKDSHFRKQSQKVMLIAGLIAGVAIVFLVIGFMLLWQKYHQIQDELVENGGNSSWRLKSFQNLSFTEEDISEALVDDENVIGSGGSGKVYRVDLKNNVTVAVKKLWSMDMSNSKKNALNKLMKAEMDTLGMVRHKNIVKLYCCLSNCNSNLLVYEYMQNGNLFDALHKSDKENASKGGDVYLDWPTRYKIALGAAHGLAYLHHDCSPAIIHRDIKSTNILLDEFYEARLADFGIAKFLQVGGGKDPTTDFAGTYGYIAPGKFRVVLIPVLKFTNSKIFFLRECLNRFYTSLWPVTLKQFWYPKGLLPNPIFYCVEYAYSFKVTERSDIYSFGVVLLELVTGKKPTEPEFGENKDIVYWVSRKICTQQGVFEVLDSRISKSYQEEMIQILKIAVHCTYKLPALRPRMREVVNMLLDADPCSGNFKSQQKERASKDKPIVIDAPERKNSVREH